MYTKQALRELGVTPSTLSQSQKKELEEQGFFTVEEVLTPDDCEKMRAEFERIHAAEKDQGGHEVHVEPGARWLYDDSTERLALQDRLAREDINPRSYAPRSPRAQHPIR